MKMLTPAELREFGKLPDNMVIPMTASAGPLLADALEIADESAWELIRGETVATRAAQNERAWYDLSTSDPESREALGQAVRYLEARGLLEHDAVHHALVSHRSPA